MKTQKMKILLGILLITCLSSCLTSCRVSRDNMPKIEDVKQLSPYFHYVTIDGKEYIDVQKSVCFSRDYRHTIDYVGPVGAYESLNIKKCNKVVGYSPVNYTKVFNYQDYVRFLIKINLDNNSEGYVEDGDSQENPVETTIDIE